jgi:phage antirepressor YoqD-like protein
MVFNGVIEQHNALRCGQREREMSNQALAVLNSTAMSMTSREIAELTGKEHGHVLRDIRAMVVELAGDPDLDHLVESKDNRGYTVEIALPKSLTLTVVTGYNAVMRKRVMDRWQELEAAAAKPAPVVVADLAQALSDPAQLRTALLAYTEKVMALETKVKEQAPAVEFVGRYVESTGSKGFRQVCKLLAANESDFREFLLDKKIMYRLGGEWMPYADHLDAGRFEVKAGTSEVSNHAFNQAKFTAKGVNWVAGEWAKYRLLQQAA